MDGSNPAKHRLNLWLKSEQALGLPSVPRINFVEAPQQAAQPPRPAANPRPQPTMPSSPRTTAAVPRPPEPATSAPPSLIVLETTYDEPILPREEKIKRLQELDSDYVKGCVRCGLSKTRSRTVFGEGDPDAPVCFIGEGPGKDEDASGRPFVGRAGQKLNDMIGAMGLKREEVYICNIVKCRAYLADIGKDRPPSEEETAACTPYLVRQVGIVRPKVIVTLGLPSTRYLLKSKDSMTRMRGNWHAWRGIRVMPTWHPAYVLRNYTEQTRREVWDDLKKVLIELGLAIPKRSGKQD
jgi:DNA polymerase